MPEIPVEYASQRKIRERNKLYYRFNHWPIWIFVFFIAPGPLTFDLFEHGFDVRMALWLGLVLVGTGVAGLRGSLPGVEPRPYIIRFTEDRPNPLYRRVCYTFAWSEVITFALLNITGLVIAIVTGQWYLKQIYRVAYFPIAGAIWLLGALGRLPRVIFLRLGMGRVLGAARTLAHVEGHPTHARGRFRQAAGLSRHPGVGREPGAARPSSPHKTDRPRRARGLRLIIWSFSHLVIVDKISQCSSFKTMTR